MSFTSPSRDSAALADANRRMRLLEERVSRLPSRWARGGSSPQVYYLSCGGGNLLVTHAGINFYGLKRPGSNVTAVPTLAPPAIGTFGTTPDGLSAATLYDAAAGTSSVVWVGVRMLPGVWSGGVIVAGAVTFDDWSGTLTKETPFLARRAASVPVTGSPDVYATVYNPWSL